MYTLLNHAFAQNTETGWIESSEGRSQWPFFDRCRRRASTSNPRSTLDADLITLSTHKALTCHEIQSPRRCIEAAGKVSPNAFMRNRRHVQVDNIHCALSNVRLRNSGHGHADNIHCALQNAFSRNRRCGKTLLDESMSTDTSSVILFAGTRNALSKPDNLTREERVMLRHAALSQRDALARRSFGRSQPVGSDLRSTVGKLSCVGLTGYLTNYRLRICGSVPAPVHHRIPVSAVASSFTATPESSTGATLFTSEGSKYASPSTNVEGSVLEKCYLEATRS